MATSKRRSKSKKAQTGFFTNFGASFLNLLFGESAVLSPDGMVSNAPMLESYLPYRSFDSKDKLFVNRQSFGFVLELAPMTGADESVADILGQLFSDGLPSGLNIQIIYHQSARIGKMVGDWLFPRYAAGGIYRRAGEYRARYLRDGAFASLSKDAPFFLRHHRVTISASADIDGSVSRDVMKAARESLGSTLDSLHIPFRILTPVELIGVVEDIVLQSRDTTDSPENYNELDTIASQCVRRDIVTYITPERLVVKGPKRRATGNDNDGTPVVSEIYPTEFDMRFFSVRNFPKSFAPWDVQRLIGDMFNDKLRYGSNVVVSLSLRYVDEEAARGKASMKWLRTKSLADSQSARLLPNIQKQAAEWEEVTQQLAEGKKVVQAYYCVGSIAELKKGDAAERRLKSVYKAAGWDLSQETFLQMHGLLTMLPCSLADGIGDDLARMKRYRTFTTKVIAGIAPLQGEYTGGDVPHMLLVGRRGQPFFWSPFQNRSGNHNVAIFGKSGSGKSVALQELMVAICGPGGKLMVIDDGRSFEHTCKALGGDFVEFKLTNSFSLNPFSLVDEALIESGDEAANEYKVDCLAMINAMVKQMVRQLDRISDNERGIIDTAVNAVWDKKGRHGSLDDVRNELLQDDSPYARDLADALRPFCLGGTYGEFFDGECSLELNAQLTVFEISGLAQREDLRPVVLTAIMFLSQEVMRRMDRSIPKMLLVDEAWQMLKGGAMADFIEAYSRTCRKYGGSLATATQSFNDFYKSEGARAALENSDWVLALSQKDESINELLRQGKFVNDTHTENLLRSARTHGREYSEILVVGPDVTALGRLVLDPYSAALYSSSPAVFQQIEKFIEMGLSTEDAIEAVAFPDKRESILSGLPLRLEAAE